MKKMTEFRLPQLTRGQKVVRNLIVIAGMCFIMFGVFFGFDKPCRTKDEAIAECLLKEAGMLPPYEIKDRYTVYDKLGNGNIEFYHSVAYVKSSLKGEDILIQVIIRTPDSFWDDYVWYKPEYYAYIESVEPYTEPEYDVRWASIANNLDLTYSAQTFTYWDDEMPQDEINGIWCDQGDWWFIQMRFYYEHERKSNEDLYFYVNKEDYSVEWLETSEYSVEQINYLGEEAAVRMAVNLAEDFEKDWRMVKEYNASGMYVTNGIAQELVEE